MVARMRNRQRIERGDYTFVGVLIGYSATTTDMTYCRCGPSGVDSIARGRSIPLFTVAACATISYLAVGSAFKMGKQKR